MSEDPEASIIDVKDSSMRLKIEFPANYAQKIMIMQRRSKEDWMTIVEQKIEDPTATQIIKDIDNLIPGTKYKFMAFLTTKNGNIKQLDELSASTKEKMNSDLKWTQTADQVIPPTKHFRCGFVGSKSSGKSALISSVVHTFTDEESKRSINNVERRNAVVDVPQLCTRLNLVEFYGSSSYSEAYLSDVRNFIHGLIPEEALLHNSSQGNIPVCLDNADQRKLDGLVITVDAAELKVNLDHIRQLLLLAINSGIRAVVFLTKTDLMYGTSNDLTDQLVTIPKGYVYRISSSHSNKEAANDLRAAQLLSAITNLVKKKEEKQRVLRLLVRQKDDIFRRCWIEENKSYVDLLRAICHTFVLAQPPKKIYELRNSIHIAVSSDVDVESLTEDALIEFE